MDVGNYQPEKKKHFFGWLWFSVRLQFERKQ